MNKNGSRLAGKVAIVTGASKGIGAEIAKQMAAEGASVVVNYSSSEEAARRVVGEIERGGGKAIAVKANMAKKAEVAALFAESDRAFGRLDILVNNAGVYEFMPIEAVTEESYRRQFDINVLGVLFATQEAVKRFGAGGGSIVNISSVVSTAMLPYASIYGSTKGALDAMTRSLAAELGPRKIRVNSVNPGMTETEGVAVMSEGSDGHFAAGEIAATPMGRIGQVGDVAPVVVFLASDEARFTTGESLRVSGGRR